MKRIVILSIGVILVVSSFFLIVTIFQLYKDSEKVQKSILTREVLSAGTDVINKIDALLKGDTLLTIKTIDPIDSTNNIVFQKQGKRFLLDPSKVTPIGVIRTTISYMKNDVILTHNDTTFFDTTYSKSFTPNQYPLDSNPISSDFNKKSKNDNVNLIEMDSNITSLLNLEYLNRIIKESLLDQNINSTFDFALYNSYTTQFVVKPHLVDPTTILNSEYIFSLKPSESFIAPHFIIIYLKDQRRILFQRMGTITSLIIAFIAIIAFLNFYTLFHLYRLKKISDIKNDFINNMTHEFKTPISTIALACEALSDPDIASGMELRDSYISIINDENNRLKKMVNNILELAQLKKGQLKIYEEHIDIHKLISVICQDFSLQIASKKGKISQYLYAKNPIIFADASHLQNVIVNLIENGIKYSHETPDIVVRTENDKRYLYIKVADNGIGIAKKNHKRIFQDFYRVSSGNIHDTKGHGLGLVYVKKIIELHGGNITVNSEIQKGSEFIISLPYKR
jgi:two-component system, OmpR family, phosphate regulon sensor histidine kinase PhoR